MPTPVTTFDQQYSDPAATAIGWEETRRVLEEAELFWISTVRADGRPTRQKNPGEASVVVAGTINPASRA